MLRLRTGILKGELVFELFSGRALAWLPAFRDNPAGEGRV
jgi:hypothetical protein